ncbi:hypothetical protein C0Q70_19312 [Pomacea canaliculata]|uniref:Uncharacterized protein n=1 Tax=Pomacea canaliculata TaxID=400727 RepID=A0A2T7NJ10_POMCA|nr:hypothetical protein C0Q70_19312 [Pomacea canaliculata]
MASSRAVGATVLSDTEGRGFGRLGFVDSYHPFPPSTPSDVCRRGSFKEAERQQQHPLHFLTDTMRLGSSTCVGHTT